MVPKSRQTESVSTEYLLFPLISICVKMYLSD